jgi:hypothetical protein
VLSKPNITVNKTTLNSITDTHHNPEETTNHSLVVCFEIMVVALLAVFTVYGLRKGWASPRYWEYIPIKDHHDSENGNGNNELASYGATTIDQNVSNGNHAATLQV